jgi:hypothetical protein
MPNSEPILEYDSVLVDEERDEEVPVGRVALSGDGMLHVVDADARGRAVWQPIIEAVNGKPCLHVRVPSPSGAAAFNVSFRRVQRSQPEFASVLADYLQQYYDVRLMPRGT